MFYNEKLADEKGLSAEDRVLLDQLYEHLYSVIAHPEDFVSPVTLVQDIENDLQRLWGFEVDATKHKYWYQIRGCTCAKMDNKELWGTPYRVYSQDCPYHGWEE